jgi:predicted enzyme related to lactoylglutathione lyase
MMKRQMPQQQITNYINVTSIDEYSSKLEKAGGRIVQPKTAVPSMGYFAVCLDTENNSFAIWESNESAK